MLLFGVPSIHHRLKSRSVPDSKLSDALKRSLTLRIGNVDADPQIASNVFHIVWLAPVDQHSIYKYKLQ